MNRNVPKLRFKGFEDEWKKEVLGDLIVEKIEKTEDKGKYPLYSLTIESGVVPKSDRYEREFLVKKEGNFKIVNNNDFVYNPMNLRFGALAIYKGDFPVSVSGYYNVFSFKNRGLEKFWDNYLKTHRMMYLYNTIATGSLEEKKRVHYSQFKELKLPMPSLKEQEKIANFLSRVDSIMEKQEKKVEYWNSYKKGMMQKIFKQEIRFKDENGRDYPEWEERALKKIIKEDLYPVNKPNVAYEKLSVRSHAKGTFSSRVDDPATVAMDTLYEVKENQLIVNITFAWEHAISIVKKEDEGKLVSHRFPTYKFNPDCYYKFYEYVIKQSSLKYKLGLASPGGAGRNRVLNKKEFLKIEVQHPCFEEQTKIANFLSNIDSIIEKENQKLEELRQWKKGLLQQMFV